MPHGTHCTAALLFVLLHTLPPRLPHVHSCPRCAHRACARPPPRGSPACAPRLTHTRAPTGKLDPWNDFTILKKGEDSIARSRNTASRWCHSDALNPRGVTPELLLQEAVQAAQSMPFGSMDRVAIETQVVMLLREMQCENLATALEVARLDSSARAQGGGASFREVSSGGGSGGGGGSGSGSGSPVKDKPLGPLNLEKLFALIGKLYVEKIHAQIAKRRAREAAARLKALAKGHVPKDTKKVFRAAGRMAALAGSMGTNGVAEVGEEAPVTEFSDPELRTLLDTIVPLKEVIQVYFEGIYGELCKSMIVSEASQRGISAQHCSAACAHSSCSSLTLLLVDQRSSHLVLATLLALLPSRMLPTSHLPRPPPDPNGVPPRVLACARVCSARRRSSSSSPPIRARATAATRVSRSSAA